jgi:hypothetical protein
MINNVFYETTEGRMERSQILRKMGQGMGPSLPIQQTGNILSRKR